MCYRTRYALKGVMVRNCIYFFVFHCSYHTLGVNLPRRFFGFFKPSEWQDFGWDDVFLGIVISTKWNAWRNPLRRSSTYPPLSFILINSSDFAFSYTRLTFSIAPLSHILTYPYFLKALSNSAILLSVFSPTSRLSLFIVFILFLFIYRCYNMLYLIIFLIF